MDERKDVWEIPDEAMDEISGGRRSGIWEPVVPCQRCGAPNTDLKGDSGKGYIYQCRYCKNEFEIDLDISGIGEPKVVYL